MAACAPDKGNYDYVPLEDPCITGIEESYSVLTNEMFEIKPLSDALTDDWTYLWKAVYLGNGRDSYVLSQEKNLSVKMSLDEGSYTLVFRATEPSTGVFWEKQSALQVSSTTSEGWMVLCDEDGRTRLDFVSSITSKTYTDVIDGLEGRGKPFELFYSYYSDPDSPFYLITSGGATRLSKQGFALDESYDLKYEMGGGEVSDVGVIADGIQGKLLVAGGNLYYSDCVVGVGLFGPVQSSAEFAPKVGVNLLTRNIVVPCYLLYDISGKRFMGYAPALGSDDLGHYDTLHEMNSLVQLLSTMEGGGRVTGNAFQSFPKGLDFVDMSSTMYDPSNTSMGIIYTVLADGAKRYVYGIQLGELWGAVTVGDCSYAIGKALYKDISGCTDIDKAEHFAFSPLRSAMYYSIGGKVWMSDLSEEEPGSKLILNYGPSEKISVLKFQKYENTENLMRNYDLIVATQSGALRVYEGFNSGGDFTGAKPSTYEGLGNIVDVNYRELL